MATAEGCATNEIMRRPGLSKSAVWNLALIGAAWAVADSLARPRR
jgi:hypothetical protein